MAVEFNDVLRASGISPIDVVLIRHQTKPSNLYRSLFELWEADPDGYRVYQNTQKPGRPILRKNSLWASFASPLHGTTVFTGLYEVYFDHTGVPEWRCPYRGDEHGQGNFVDIFQSALRPELSEYIGRMFIQWDKGAVRSWARYAANAHFRVVGNYQPDSQTSAFANGMSTSEFVEYTNSIVTEREQIQLARLGQGMFRHALLKAWNGTCPLTGLSHPELLRASHIKPWAKSSNRERLDPYNGLLLSVHIDALFDSGLLSFDDDGRILISRRLTNDDIGKLGIHRDVALTGLTSEHRQYLQHHRTERFKR